MGFFGELLRQVPQGVAAYQQGQQAGERERREAQERDQDRKRDERRAMLEEALLSLQIKERSQPQKPVFKASAGGVSTEFSTPEDAQAFVSRFGKPEQPDPITVNGRQFPNTPEGAQQALAWHQQMDPPAASTAQPPVIGLGARDEATWLRRMQMQNAAKPPGGGQVTEGERRAAFVFEGAKNAAASIDALDRQGVKLGPLDRLPLVGNAIQSSEEQTMRQAASTLMDAYLRLTTGANYSQKEVEQAAQQIIPVLGDKPEVLAAKRVRRQEIIRAIEGYARRAMPQEQPAGGALDLAQTDAGKALLRLLGGNQ